ncbi:MAG: macro domain-containing protein [Actinobacteria bacterium]|nr:macro domain-containing protein [Actinomycetota bacterium]
MSFRIDNTEIVIEQGDITEIDVEAVVSAANNQLYMGAGVAGAIKRKGGQEIEEEAVRKGPIPVGSAIITSGGRLKAKHVIHAAVMGIDLVTDAEKIKNATLSALGVAEEASIKSIAFPALGTGIGGFPLNEAARIMFNAVKEHIGSRKSSLGKIIFVPFGYEAYSEFLRRADVDFKSAE